MQPLKFEKNGALKKTKRNVANAYRRAAAWLEQNPGKWGAYRLYDEKTGCYCANGAIDLVCGVPYAVRKRTTAGTIPQAIADVLDEVKNDDIGNLWALNDYQFRIEYKTGTAPRILSDVTKQMRKIARDLDHGGSL